MRDEPNGRGLSRKAILYRARQSLRRLGTDYVDLYQIHRWDYATPIEETLEALHDVVKAGQGALHRRLLHARLAVRQGALPGRPPRLDALRLHAEPLQPALPGGGARDDAPLPGPRASASSPGAPWPGAGWPGPGRARPPRAWPTDKFGRTPLRPDRSRRPPRGGPPGGTVRTARGAPGPDGPGLAAGQAASPRPSSGPPGRTTCSDAAAAWNCGSAPKRSRPWRRPM